VVKASIFENLVESGGKPEDGTFRCAVIEDPKYREPLLLVTPQPLSGETCRALYRDRWPVEQVPLSGKQRVGAQRQFVFGEERRQRLPEMALFAGRVLL